MAHADEVDDGEEEPDDDEPHETASVLAPHPPRIEVYHKNSPSRNRQPDFRIAGTEVFARRTEEPDQPHGEANREKKEAGAGGVIGGGCRGVQSRQEAIQATTLKQPCLDDVDDGSAEGDGEAHVTQKGDSYVDAEPGKSQEDAFGIIKTDRHEHGVEETEEGEGGDKHAQLL